MREWTERHIRELIDDEFKKLKKPSGGDFTITIANWDRDDEIDNYTIDFFAYNNNQSVIRALQEYRLNGTILFKKVGHNSQTREIYNVKLIEKRQYGSDLIAYTYELGDQIWTFSNSCYTSDNEPYITAVPGNTFLTIYNNLFLKPYGYINIGELQEINDFYLVQNDKKFRLSEGIGKAIIDNTEYNIRGNGKFLLFRNDNDETWLQYDYNKPSKLIVTGSSWTQ